LRCVREQLRHAQPEPVTPEPPAEAAESPPHHPHGSSSALRAEPEPAQSTPAPPQRRPSARRPWRTTASAEPDTNDSAERAAPPVVPDTGAACRSTRNGRRHDERPNASPPPTPPPAHEMRPQRTLGPLSHVSPRRHPEPDASPRDAPPDTAPTRHELSPQNPSTTPPAAAHSYAQSVPRVMHRPRLMHTRIDILWTSRHIPRSAHVCG
jgi:hypothetical protein